MAKTNVVVTFQMEGFHNWPEAGDYFPDAEFLENRHRHMFHFTLKSKVRHDDRDIEFILFAREVKNWLNDEYYINGALEFGRMSCEMIAQKLLEQFECEYVSVFEDGENGAEVFLEPDEIRASLFNTNEKESKLDEKTAVFLTELSQSMLAAKVPALLPSQYTAIIQVLESGTFDELDKG